MEALKIELEQYTGPLDLLLSLIVKHKIDIFDIPIAEITEQYLAYLDEMRSLNMDIASEFIQMASELMLIKSKLLLPKSEPEEDPRQPLVDALLEYRRAKEATNILRDRSLLYYDRFVRQPAELDLPYNREHDLSLLYDAFSRIANRISQRGSEIKPAELFEKLHSGKNVTVGEKTVWLLRQLYMLKTADFEELFSTLEGVEELCAAFLALLELLNNGRIGISRENEKIFLYLRQNKDKENNPSEA